MTGVFGTSAPITIDLTLIVQIAAFVLVAAAVVLEIKRKWKLHGFVMSGALVLHFISFFVVMVPLLMSNFSLYVTGTSFLFIQTMWVHAISGALVLVLGFFMIIVWIPKPSSLKHCFRRKRLMDVTALLWAISLAFAIITYIVTYAQ